MKNKKSGTFEDDFLKNTSTFFLETKGIHVIRVVDFESGENRVALGASKEVLVDRLPDFHENEFFRTLFLINFVALVHLLRLLKTA